MDRKIDLVNGVAKLSDTSAITLGGDGTNTVTFKVGSGFGSGAQVSQLALFDWNPTVPHQGTPLGTWQRSSSSTQPFGALNITVNGVNIDVSDVSDDTAEYDYCFSVTVNDGKDHTTPDPELRVKKKRT